MRLDPILALHSGRLQVDALAPVGEAGDLHPPVRLYSIRVEEWNAIARELRPGGHTVQL